MLFIFLHCKQQTKKCLFLLGLVLEEEFKNVFSLVFSWLSILVKYEMFITWEVKGGTRLTYVGCRVNPEVTAMWIYSIKSVLPSKSHTGTVQGLSQIFNK